MIFRFLLTLIICCMTAILSSAQCVSTFPYRQDFEANRGSWTSGGTANDWAWGTPNKSKINRAGQGTKCWITGGLSGTSYNNGERSYLESPCFDFSSLSNPIIEFKYFIETEQDFDGANLQYSTNGGTTWINVGVDNEPNDCYTLNWYNSTTIAYLNTLATTRNGWSGNSKQSSGSCLGGGGPGIWVTARHCLSNLANRPNVTFRFTFGAGTSCNSYDGFAVDDISIQNAPRYTANFSAACIGNKQFRFTDQSTNCPSSWRWNFGDGGTSTTQNPTHTFSGSGPFTVTLVSRNGCALNDTVSLQVSIPTISLTKSDVSCPGKNDGWIKATVSGIPASTTPSFSWNSAQTGDSIFGLRGGNYSVSLNLPNACTASATTTISEPPAFIHSVTTTEASCNANDGSASVVINGGTPPYSFSWNPALASGINAANLPAGNYILTITDSKNCIDTLHAEITSKAPNINGFLSSFNIDLFTPNGDGVNDVFEWLPASLVPESYEVMVFDRWGNTVFKTEKPGDSWDGKNRVSGMMMPDGKYFYVLKGKNCGGQNFEKSGYIQLLK